MPHTLIFVDLPSPDPEASGRFYEAVFGWTVEGRPAGTFHRIVPGGEFPGPDGKDSGVGNLHLGIYSTANPVPDPNVPSTHAGERPSGPMPRVYILVDKDEEQEAIVGRAKENGATVDWELAWFGEFNGWCSSFTDPWGVQILLWTTGANRPGPDAAA
ncbi:MAG TPA: VOC family protein [Acidimicrobiales bacterium]